MNLIYKNNNFNIQKMKTIIDVITESMNDYGNDFKECETLEQFICKFLAINDLDDFNKYLYSELEDNGDCIPFDQGDFKSTRKWIIANEDEPISDVKVMRDKHSTSLSPCGVLQLKLKNKVYRFPL